MKNDLEATFKKFYKPLVYFANKYVEDKMDAEDIVIDVFIAWNNYDSSDKEIKLQSFLYQMVKNRCIDYERKKRRVKKNASELLYLTSEEYTEINRLEAEVLNDLYSKTEALPDQQKKIFKFYLFGKSTVWIANECKLSMQTVLNTKAAVIKNLKKNSFEN